MGFLGYIFFDLDGTLVDSLNELGVAFGYILKKEYNIPPLYSQREFLKTAGRPLDEQYRYVIKKYRRVDVHNTDWLVGLFWDSIRQLKPALFPEVESTLEELYRGGYVLLVSSSTSQLIVDSVLAQTQIGKYFRFALGTDYQHRLSSKGKKHLQIAARRLGVSYKYLVSNSAFVGDTEFDMTMAKAAKMFAIYRAQAEVSELQIACDAVIHDLTELLSLLRKKNNFFPIETLRQ
jgi:phosphoglycolate phosphatase-like HAD superfamily hydrolase